MNKKQIKFKKTGIDRITDKRRWDMVRSFENAYKERFLGKLTQNESLKIFHDLYRFASKMAGEDYYKKVDMLKIQALSDTRALLRKIR